MLTGLDRSWMDNIVGFELHNILLALIDERQWLFIHRERKYNDGPGNRFIYVLKVWSSIISNEWDMKRICIIERTKWSSNELKETFNLF